MRYSLDESILNSEKWFTCCDPLYAFSVDGSWEDLYNFISNCFPENYTVKDRTKKLINDCHKLIHGAGLIQSQNIIVFTIFSITDYRFLFALRQLKKLELELSQIGWSSVCKISKYQ